MDDWMTMVAVLMLVMQNLNKLLQHLVSLEDLVGGNQCPRKKTLIDNAQKTEYHRYMAKPEKSNQYLRLHIDKWVVT